MLFIGILTGFVLYAVVRVLLSGFYTVKPDERAVLTSFGRAVRLGNATVTATDQLIPDEEKDRYKYPVLRVISPGGPYFKWPWQNVHKVSIATQAVNITWDPSKDQDTIEAVTKDNLTTGVNGQLRYRVSENNLYPYLFGVTSPLEHVMGFFVSVLRERIANFEDPKGAALLATAEAGASESSGTAVELSEGVSINDLRKNLPLLNQYMEQQCEGTVYRYGIELDAALITEIDPPPEVDRALSAINSTRNQVAADISTARADAEQQITMSKRAVDIATNNAEAEIAPLQELAATLTQVKSEGGSPALRAYLRNMRLPLLERTRRIIESPATGGAR
ncbi:MAG: SPFH domain-containing protein [Kiritimatiellia bacterium]